MRKWGRAAALVGVSTAIGVWSSTEQGSALDHRVFHAINDERHPVLDGFFRSITELGSIWAQVGAAAVLLKAGRRRAVQRALVASAITWTASQGMKKLWMRTRPYDHFEEGTARLLVAKLGGTSWPSSHPAVLFAFITAAERELGLGRGTRLVLAALAGKVAASRIGVGVHFPSDVASGLLLGRAVGLVCSEEAAGTSPALRTNGR